MAKKESGVNVDMQQESTEHKETEPKEIMLESTEHKETVSCSLEFINRICQPFSSVFLSQQTCQQLPW